MGKLIVKTEFLEKTLPVLLVQLGGYIDQSNSDKLQKVFDDLFSSEHYFLIFDLTHLIYMSSSGWGVFVGEVKRFRENGGDIKLANMSSEIYELYQMLEFYHILEDYYSIDEALESYGIKVEKKTEDKVTEEINDNKKSQSSDGSTGDFMEKESELFELDKISKEGSDSELHPEANKIEFQLAQDEGTFKEPLERGLEIDISILPLQEKVRKIISKYPLLSLAQMKKMLRHEEFGRERIGIFKLYFLLKSMNLETKAKRYRFYRSC
jgi:anti-anti-sigma factor